MTDRLDVAPKRSRESTSKVRTGCNTCKSRHVKCDEAKPSCQRCVKAGRTCEYKNTHEVQPKRNIITVYLPPTKSQPVLSLNDRNVDFFHHNIAAKLDGQFDSEFWSKLVLQLSHSEPSIRHAVSAVSIIYHDAEASSLQSIGGTSANLQAEQEWNMAVRKLSARMQAHPNSNLVPLVCCLLFTCIEFLKSDIESSMLHVKSGFNILAALGRGRSVASSTSDEYKAIIDNIVPIFSRLNVLCSLHGIMTPVLHDRRTEEDSAQQDLLDSRRQLFEISDSCIRFIGVANWKVANSQIDIDDLIEQVKLQIRLEKWRNQLDKLLKRIQVAGDHVKDDSLNLLLVHYKVVFIWTRVCTIPGEMATDSYQADFDELVRHAELLAKPGAAVVVPIPLSFELSILAPVYYTVLKCRHPTIRRRALELVRLAPVRDALFNARHAYVTGKRVIELEERHLDVQGIPLETSRIDSSTRKNIFGRMPVETSRIYGLPLPELESQVYPGTVEAEFHTKPFGQSGEWHIITEYIKL